MNTLITQDAQPLWEPVVSQELSQNDGDVSVLHIGKPVYTHEEAMREAQRMSQTIPDVIYIAARRTTASRNNAILENIQ